MIEGRDIICVTFGAWDDMVETPQYLMTRLAARNRVLFVDQPVAPLEFLHGTRSPGAMVRKLRRWRNGLRQVSENMWVGAPPPVLPLRTTSPSNRISTAVMRRWLARQVRALGFQKPIYWSFQPRFPNLGRGLDASLRVYYCVDDFAAAPYWWNPKAGVRAREAECCREADVVICTGRQLVATRKELNPNTHFIAEGADVDLFATALQPETQPPPEIASLPGKVIGYAGMINWRIDVDLMVYLAERHPEWSFALVGPVKEDENLARLTRLPNVHCFGRKTVAELPAYLKAMDVCLIPYVLNDYTHNIFPLKLYEYMAAGKPIVATDMAEMRAYEGEEMAIGRSPEDFHDKIVRAMEEDTPERAAARRRTAAQHSWDHRIEEISALLEPVLERRGGVPPREQGAALREAAR
jgi:glycosyltransferase involved in cell wall biosynthesis